MGLIDDAMNSSTTASERATRNREWHARYDWRYLADKERDRPFWAQDPFRIGSSDASLREVSTLPDSAQEVVEDFISRAGVAALATHGWVVPTPQAHLLFRSLSGARIDLPTYPASFKEQRARKKAEQSFRASLKEIELRLSRDGESASQWRLKLSGEHMDDSSLDFELVQLASGRLMYVRHEDGSRYRTLEDSLAAAAANMLRGSVS